MSVFETIYAESLYRDLIRLSNTDDHVATTRIMKRMIENVYEAVRDHVLSADLVNKIIKLDVDLDPKDLVNMIHQIIRPHFVDDVTGVSA